MRIGMSRSIVLIAVLSAAICSVNASQRYDGDAVLRPEPTVPGEPQQRRPNIVFILTDDQDAVMGGDWHMPKLSQHLAQQGINFTNYVANFALCCPSRSTILAGQCSHNTGVVGVGGDRNMLNVLGGFERFNDMGLETKAAPYHLQQAGYRTGLIGKYLNGYTRETAFHVPPGYDRWYAIGEIDYYNWTVSDQGVNVEFGNREEDYSTDVLTQQAVEFIGQAEADDRPFFLYLAPYACHRPHIPAKRHIGKLKGLKVPRVASWNESDHHLAGKVSFVRSLPHVDEETAAAYDLEYQTRAETLLAVDDMIEAVVQALEDVGQLENTYIFYTPDNGFKLGHHRLGGKMTPYENDIRLPFYVRGPGVPKGVKLPHLVGNVDLASTWLELGGVKDPHAHTRDGTSLVPILRGDPELLANPDRHRVGILIEKPVTTGIFDMHVSILTPIQDPQNDPFAGRRPERLPNGSWPIQILETEFQGERFNEMTEARLKSDAWYFGYEHEEGYKQYLELAEASGVSARAVAKAANEIFPTAYYGLRALWQGGFYKFIEYPGGYELYDLSTDPHETENIFSSASPELIAALQATLNQLKVCRGRTCVVKSISATVANFKLGASS
ncbi:hypothetical protein ABPG77_002978 [Micractinium sp. CCAP 211/92]